MAGFTDMHTPAALGQSVNPIVWMRAVLMDLGFGGLIEKFEEYFGRGITGALLAVLVVLVFTWGLKEWLEFLVASQLAVQQGDGESWWVQVKFFAATAVPSLVVLLLFWAARRRQARAYAEKLEKMNAEFASERKRQVESFQQEIEAHSAEDLRRLSDMIEEARVAIAAAQEAHADNMTPADDR